METLIGHLINGKISTAHEKKQAVYNPATGDVIKQVALAGAQTVEEAIAAAQAAFPAWRDTPVLKRARVMFKFKAV
jgi:malonate-semialdehyde dehydrogenase (acetylating)/methylmalonate-semialdehyde dehydrogenase